MSDTVELDTPAAHGIKYRIEVWPDFFWRVVVVSQAGNLVVEQGQSVSEEEAIRFAKRACEAYTSRAKADPTTILEIEH